MAFLNKFSCKSYPKAVSNLSKMSELLNILNILKTFINEAYLLFKRLSEGLLLIP